MSFFNQKINQEENLNSDQNEFNNNLDLNLEDDTDSIVPDNNVENGSDQELEFNRKNREDFENLMKDSSTQLDGYWDKNNPFVKLILFILFGIIVAGVVYYVLAYLGSH